MAKDQSIAMDAEALERFLSAEFLQVAEEFSLEEVTADHLIVRLNVSDKHLRPGGTISGPSLFALADVGVYLAILSRIGPVELAVTTNCSIDFMRKPAAGVDVLCHTRLLKLGRVLAVGDCLLFSDGVEAPVARATLTYSIPPNR
ncbi:MAG: PaaI family thioesterase [Pseudomonadota bacterium]